jgi:hypothetical protein
MTWGWQPDPVTRLRPAWIGRAWEPGPRLVAHTVRPRRPVGVPVRAHRPKLRTSSPDRERACGRGHLYGPAGVDVTAGDAVEFTSLWGRFRVVGEAAAVASRDRHRSRTVGRLMAYRARETEPGWVQRVPELCSRRCQAILEEKGEDQSPPPRRTEDRCTDDAGDPFRVTHRPQRSRAVTASCGLRTSTGSSPKRHDRALSKAIG